MEGTFAVIAQTRTACARELSPLGYSLLRFRPASTTAVTQIAELQLRAAVLASLRTCCCFHAWVGI